MALTAFPARASGPAERLADFVAHLRMNGWTLGPGETAAALEALCHVRAEDMAEARAALRVLLAADQDTWDTFDALFDAYWANAGKTRQGAAQTHVKRQMARPMLWQDHFGGPDNSGDDDSALEPGDGGGDADGADGRLLATRQEVLTRRDLRDLMDEGTLRAAEATAARLARALRDRRSRRRKAARRGTQLDLRRIQRASLARGGEPLDLFRKRRPERPMQLVALVDVSGSMSVYARVFLAFLRGLTSVDTKTEAFVFHTRLMRVTEALRDHDTLRAAGRLSLMAEGFGGGTDIGRALATFVIGHAARRLNSRSVVLVVSDGYCTGAPEALADSLAQIRRRARRVVWLNPLAGWAGHPPVARAMQAALPHLDAHLPAGTLEALAALEPEFAKL